ncbi:MAG: beta-ketoacyl synthase chain length factor, partial [Burkholderiales bacterium]|nr:beta-ketoacyl synthase chain length factor [Burkholderiales bacterium]
PAPQRLPATERRRAGALVRASIAAADQALGGADAAAVATVFSSSTGDPLNCPLLCEALAAAERSVSPTRFTNSVHNAAAGYWHIAAASRQPSTSLAAHDASFGVGLLEAAVQCAAARAPVLLVACDLPYPEPLHALRPVADVFATALLLVPAGGRGLRLTVGAEGAASRCADAGLEALRLGIPAARALPLLRALAANAAATLHIEGQPGWGLALELEAASAAPAP